MIKSSGISVYPSQVEDVLNSHPEVLMSCVIGVSDEYKIQKVKAFVSLRNPEKAGKDMEEKLLRHCRTSLIKWSIPSEIEFRKEFPKTMIGKISFKELEKEEKEKIIIK
jgi:long-chain acyl-CoA synthetase